MYVHIQAYVVKYGNEYLSKKLSPRYKRAYLHVSIAVFPFRSGATKI